MADIKQAIEYSKQNPTSLFATELRKRIESGSMNKELESAGLTNFIPKPKEVPFMGIPAGAKPDVIAPSKTLSEIGNNAYDTVKQQIAGTGEYAGQSPLRRGVEATFTASNVVPEAALNLLPDQARNVLQKAGKGINEGFNVGIDAIKWLGDKIGSTELAQKIVAAHPGVVDTILGASKETVGTLAPLGGIAGNILLADQAANVGQAVLDKAKTAYTSYKTPTPPVSGAEDINSVLPNVRNNVANLTGENPVRPGFSSYGDIKTLQSSPEFPTLLQHVKDDAIQSLTNAGIKIPSELKGMTVTLDNVRSIPNLVESAITGSKVLPTVATPAVESAASIGSKLKNNIQMSIADKNISPQLKVSANRLFLDGTKVLEDPVSTYNQYLDQSKIALKDIKADPAISSVGNKMGDAFDKVVRQRQRVGKVLGDELKSVGKLKINIDQPKFALLTDLKDSGLSYNPKTNSLTSFQGTKFVPEEINMLDTFVKDVNALGSNPSVSAINNFITKTRTALKFTQGKTGVIGTTNAERIINSGIAKLKETLNPKVNGIPELKRYWQANQTYSDLSDFIDEGSGFMGRKTLSGDYAKDASVAKSSVQSILNQGKKDFMVKLEALTGYPALDDAVLALQAMKDAGDFRGLSLLQAMSESGVPTSAAGFTQKILNYAIKKGGEIIAGTPEQQTRAILQDLSNKAKAPTTAKPSATSMPKGGQSTNKINQSNSAISKTIPPIKTPVKKPYVNKQGGYIRIGIPKIDKQVMIDFIDSFRTGKVGDSTSGKIIGSALTPKQKLDFEIEARRLAPKYGFNPDLSPAQLVKKFDDYLSTK